MEFYENLDKAMEHFAKTGGFLTVKGPDGRVNTMTISWGFIGYLWNKPHFITVVRPQRFTREVLEGADSFTVSVPTQALREQLIVCGRQSGRDIDKSTVVDFVPSKAVESPIVGGCDLYYECKIKYIDKLHGDKIPEDVNKTMYNQDWHDFFIGEIVEAYSINVN